MNELCAKKPHSFLQHRQDEWVRACEYALYMILTDFNFVNKSEFIAKKEIILVLWHKFDGSALANFRVDGQLPKTLLG